jgi:hypothetical protein
MALGWLRTGKLPKRPSTFRKDVLAYIGAKDAFATIARPALNRKLFWEKLWELAYLAEVRNPNANRWYALPGFPLRTLQRLPERVRGWADEIERLENGIQTSKAYGFLRPSLPLLLNPQLAHGRNLDYAKGVPEAIKRNIVARREELSKLTELPCHLRLYADCREALFKVTAHLASQTSDQYQANLRWAFINYVENVTGRPHFEEIATLLTAAYCARGLQEIVDANNLKTQHSRYSRQKR